MSEAAKEGVRVRILRSFKDSFIKCSSLTDMTSSSSRISSLHSVYSPSGSRWSIFKVPSNCPRALPFHVSSRSCILSCCWRHCICFVLVNFSVISNCSLDWATLSGTSVRTLAFISAAQLSHHSGLLGSCCQALSVSPACLGLAHVICEALAAGTPVVGWRAIPSSHVVLPAISRLPVLLLIDWRWQPSRLIALWQCCLHSKSSVSGRSCLQLFLMGLSAGTGFLRSLLALAEQRALHSPPDPPRAHCVRWSCRPRRCVSSGSRPARSASCSPRTHSLDSFGIRQRSLLL